MMIVNNEFLSRIVFNKISAACIGVEDVKIHNVPTREGEDLCIVLTKLNIEGFNLFCSYESVGLEVEDLIDKVRLDTIKFHSSLFESFNDKEFIKSQLLNRAYFEDGSLVLMQGVETEISAIVSDICNICESSAEVLVNLENLDLNQTLTNFLV